MAELSKVPEFRGFTLEIGGLRWMLCDRISVKERCQPASYASDTLELHEVYSGFQIIDEPHQMDIQSTSVIIKVKKHDNPEDTQISEEISTEIEHIQLTEDCKSAPELLGYSIQRQGTSHSVPGGYIAFNVMSRVPGVDLSNYPVMEKEEQRRVQLALLEALWEFHKYRLRHWGQRLPNIVWDAKNDEWLGAPSLVIRPWLIRGSYIVDLEDVEYFPDRKPDNVSINPWEQLSLVMGSG
ncbi:uncharacterized protein BDV14DRAFT_194814 [Aspergillus stella-maris]|uniref:uncharacterized protein n=1 Tax=Aspergillus stella-maris TaxID=1810926 RepID=UPI003CCDA56A